MLTAWITDPVPPLLSELPTGPVLIEAAPGTGVYRLGPDYGDAEQMILGAAKRSEAGRKRIGYRHRKNLK